MVFSRPQSVVAEFIHKPSDIPGSPESLAEPLVRVAAIVRRRAVAADVVELYLADIECVEPLDHVSI